MKDNTTASPPALDEETIAFAGRVFHCARIGHAADLDELLRMGLPANLRNDKGDTLLMLATYHEHTDCVRLLLEANADPDIANDRGQTPLAAACFRGNQEIVQLLLRHGAKVDGHGETGRTALMMAAMFNRSEIVELLLE